MHRELEMAYVERYWHIMDGRSASFVLTQKAGPDDDVVIFRYLQLCEDELELRKLGRVTDSTWEFWASSMHQQVSVAAYFDALVVIPVDQFEYLRCLLEHGAEHDPLKQKWLHRRLRGL
jgi:hypothetical protein